MKVCARTHTHARTHTNARTHAHAQVDANKIRLGATGPTAWIGRREYGEGLADLRGQLERQANKITELEAKITELEARITEKSGQYHPTARARNAMHVVTGPARVRQGGKGPRDLSGMYQGDLSARLVRDVAAVMKRRLYPAKVIAGHKNQVEQVQSGRRMWHALAGLPRKVETTAPSPSSHPTHMATKIKLLAKDGKEFEVEKDVACLSETVSASTDQIATNTGHHINWVRFPVWRKRIRD